MKKILLIDNDKEYCDKFNVFFKAKNADVIVKNDVVESMKIIIKHEYDIVIINEELTLFSPDGLLKIIKEIDSSIIVIIIANVANEKSELAFLKYGIDDFFHKKMSLEIMYERIKKIQRLYRSNNNSIGVSEVLFSAQENLSLNTDNRIVKKDDKLLKLSFIEFDILVYFLENKNTIIKREEFLEKIWNVSLDDSVNDPRIVDAHIKNIRKKTEINAIKTIRNYGYQWVEDL